MTRRTALLWKVPRLETEQDRIEAEASHWLVWFSEGERTQPDRIAFEQWLLADERHGDAYDTLSCVWEDGRALQHLRLPERSQASAYETWLARGLSALRPVAVATAAVCAVAVAAVLLEPIVRAPEATYTTQIAETRRLALPDGSTVMLGADSNLDVYFTERERRVTLRSGEAFFEIAHDADRPFFVDAGGPLVRVVGTKFNVRRGQDAVSVAVLEGVVRVSEGGAGDVARSLTAGSRADVPIGPAFVLLQPSEPMRISVVQPAQVAAWRSGRLSYEDAPLTVLVDDVNRYYGPGVTLASRELGDLRVTASFRTDEIAEFVGALGAALPVEVVQGEDNSFSVRPAS